MTYLHRNKIINLSNVHPFTGLSGNLLGVDWTVDKSQPNLVRILNRSRIELASTSTLPPVDENGETILDCYGEPAYTGFADLKRAVEVANNFAVDVMNVTAKIRGAKTPEMAHRGVSWDYESAKQIIPLAQIVPGLRKHAKQLEGRQWFTEEVQAALHDPWVAVGKESLRDILGVSEDNNFRHSGVTDLRIEKKDALAPLIDIYEPFRTHKAGIRYARYMEDPGNKQIERRFRSEIGDSGPERVATNHAWKYIVLPTMRGFVVALQRELISPASFGALVKALRLGYLDLARVAEESRTGCGGEIISRVERALKIFDNPIARNNDALQLAAEDRERLHEKWRRAGSEVILTPSELLNQHRPARRKVLNTHATQPVYQRPQASKRRMAEASHPDQPKLF